MVLFLAGIILLCVGYFTYGKMVEKIVGPDDRKTPAVTHADGVDYVVLPHWKNMLIQLLNIAGVGPVIGVILGIKFGSIVFIILPLGNLIAGATHDFLAGMMSLRDNGANLPKIVKDNLGPLYGKIFSWFMVGLLLLVVAVFINVPASLSNGMTGGNAGTFWIWVGVIFIYYIIATLFPVDKIIGRVYPLFGLLLLLGTAAVFAALMIEAIKNPALLEMSESFRKNMFREPNAPIIPLLFVTIACGIISGFHATQSPIVARTMVTERQARSTFYGMMVVEGIIGMIWAGAGLAVYNLVPELMNGSPNTALLEITKHFLGPAMGGITVVAVIILAVTSGDTALRSTRLSLSEMFHLDQKSFAKRLGLCVPLIGVVSLLLYWSNTSKGSFAILWNYFAWGNQVLAATTLMAATAYLASRKKNYLIAMVPGVFLTFIVLCYILWTSPAYKQAYGFGLPMELARDFALMGSFIFAIYAWTRGKAMENSQDQ